MASTLPAFGDCCLPCESPATVSVPGPEGPAGANGTDGVNGFTTVAVAFVNPAIGATVDVTVDTTTPIVGANYVWCGDNLYAVDTIIDGTTVRLELSSGTVGMTVPIGDHLFPTMPAAGLIWNPDAAKYYQLTITGAEGAEVFSWGPVP